MPNITTNHAITYTNFFDTMLDKHPNISIVCGGDLNRLDLTRLKRITGWTALVDFPTRGDSFLDNCFTISQISSEKRIL